MPPAFPAEPEVPAEQRARSAINLRYEDIAQDGRVMAGAMPNTFSGAMWGKLLGKHPSAGLIRSEGIVPILNRLVLIGAPGPFSIARDFEAEACFDLAHARSADGEVERILLRLWGKLYGPHGSLMAPSPRGSPLAVAGQAYAEHVFTRLFAPPEQRKVRSLGFPGLEPVPGPCVEIRATDDLLTLPEGAEPLDAGLVADEALITFSLGHSDSNQHVNSLVYPRLFEEAALRRLAAHGESTLVLARSLECAYRKPCFAGERARFWSRAFRLGSARGAVGALFPDGSGPSDSRPSCCLRVLWEP